MTAGAFPLTGVAKLPNATIAFPGEVWSNARAQGNIVPGAAIFLKNNAGKRAVKQAAAADTIVKEMVGVAMRQVAIPDVNAGSEYGTALGPNEIVNTLIADGDYCRRVMTGAMHLTLIEPEIAYVPGAVVGWDPLAVRPAGKAAGTGAWTLAGADTLDTTEIFEVQEFRAYGEDGEGLLTVRFLRSNV